jgi:hypothetical protein
MEEEEEEEEDERKSLQDWGGIEEGWCCVKLLN